MDNILSTAEYKALFDTLHLMYAPDQDKLEAVMSKALENVADKIMLGKLEAQLVSPPSQFSPAQNLHLIFYKSKMGYEENTFSRRYDTGEKGKFLINAYPVKGYTWGMEEIEAVDLICETIFVFAGRARLVHLMDRVTTRDVLTQIPNQVSVLSYAGMLESKGQLMDYAGIFINIKNFGVVNKRGGSRTGDLCLKKYARNLYDYIKDKGMVGRLGGDNFYCVIRKDSLEEFINFVKLQVIICELPNRTYRFELEARLGIVEMQEGYTVSDMLTYTGMAIDFSKYNSSKDVIFFNDEMFKTLLLRKELTAVFPKAIEAREFVVYYQPKVSLSDYSICGCEALVRWIRNGKIVPPMEFVPILENEGNICTLDFYVFEEACKNIREWLDSGIIPVKVSSNFSRLHLHNKEFTNVIFQIMDRYNVEGKYIQIELTETSGYENNDAFINVVDELREKGISVAIDDFGTGYSSINLLRVANVDVIKLDKSFFEEEKEGSERYKIMVRNVVRMINELNMSVIAEGVETIEQVNFLREIDCNMTQGYYFDKPLPHDEFEQRLITRKYNRE